MKTLDEVIEAMTNEICLNSKADCWEVPVNLYGVIIHYLHEYRSEKIQWEADRKLWADNQEQVAETRQKYIDKLKELEIGTMNDPLTWDELKEMEGKPVWVETKKFGSRWYLFEIDDIKIMCVGRYGEHIQLFRFEMNKGDWQAYRKERK